jgi:periplasmic divalent cation tolerance protein
MNPFAVVLCTCSSEREAETIASALVELHLAACVQILPAMRSIYRWQGKMESATEHLLLIKTSQARYPQVESKIHELHSYDVPEVIALPITAGSDQYLRWLESGLDA